MEGDNDLENSYKYVQREVDGNQTFEQPINEGGWDKSFTTGMEGIRKKLVIAWISRVPRKLQFPKT